MYWRYDRVRHSGEQAVDQMRSGDGLRLGATISLELGICGVAAAVANAVYNATGVRVRDYPITLDKLIERMPDIG
jgi:hypothetical protein